MNIGIYEYYEEKEGDVTALYLAKREHSVLAIEVMIEFGRFPSNKREVLISHELLQEKYKVKDNFKVWVGKKIVFKGEEYTISGILYSIKDSSVSGNKNGNFDSYINEDVYYFRTKGNLVFIPYDTMKELFSPKEKVIGNSDVK